MVNQAPVVLCILDGWGCREPAPDNAISTAHTPVWDRLLARYPHTQLATSGLAVGLPEGQMGNSEVGHMTIGSGQIQLQHLPRIDRALEEGTLAQHEAMHRMIEELRQSGKACHIMGLLSDGGVHAHSRHILACAKMLVEQGIAVKLHAFLDGRDTAPGTAPTFLAEAEKLCDASSGRTQIASIAGRFFAMDRDQRWERIEQAYHAITKGNASGAPSYTDPVQHVTALSQEEVWDEFVPPAIAQSYTGVEEGDALLMANFRADRVRQILHALLTPNFQAFPRSTVPSWSHAIGMVEYAEDLTPHHAVLFPSQTTDHSLGSWVAEHGLAQLRLAETEKYAHVTFFLNGGVEAPFPKEARILVPSPKVATYDLEPAMSAVKVTDHLVEAIASKDYDLIVVNYANTDMVGHSGQFEAACAAVETIDACLERVYEAITHAGGVLCITADHGNAEQMRDAHGNPHTQHTTGPVPFVLVAPALIPQDDPTKAEHHRLQEGGLQDIAPTLLHLLGLPIPPTMTGHVLLPT